MNINRGEEQETLASPFSRRQTRTASHDESTLWRSKILQLDSNKQSTVLQIDFAHCFNTFQVDFHLSALSACIMLQTTRRLPKPRHHNSPKTSTASRISQFYTHRLQAYAFGFQPSSLVLKSHNSFLISAYSGCRAQEILCQINKSVR